MKGEVVMTVGAAVLLSSSNAWSVPNVPVHLRVLSADTDETPIGSELDRIYTTDPGSMASQVLPLADLVSRAGALTESFGLLPVDPEEDRRIEEYLSSKIKRPGNKRQLSRR